MCRKFLYCCPVKLSENVPAVRSCFETSGQLLFSFGKERCFLLEKPPASKQYVKTPS